jgi:anti-anti-sigma factor
MSSVPTSSEGFKAEAIQLGHRAVVVLSGELHAANSRALDTCLAELESQGTIDIEINFSELRNIDPSGLAILRRHRNAVDALGGSLVMQDALFRALKLLGDTGMGGLLNETKGNASEISSP